MFPRVIALILSLLGAGQLVAAEVDGLTPRMVGSLSSVDDETVQEPKVVEVRR